MAVITDWGLRTVPEHLAERWKKEGYWTDETLGEILETGLRTHPDLAVKFRSSVRPWNGTYASLHELASKVAGGLAARGVGPGDIVAFQLPNWVEAAATFYAVSFLGAVVVPIVHFYGAKEVSYILRRTRVRVFVTADRFGHLDYLTNLDGMRADLPDLEHVLVVGDGPVPDWAEPFDALTEGVEPIPAPLHTDPDAPALVAYTSGTTSDPKGVVHAHRSIVFEIKQLGAVQPMEAPPTLTGAPVGHGIGLLSALLLPVRNGAPIHLIDVWDPATVLDAMLEDQLMAGAGAPYFLLSLLDHPNCTDEHRRLMRWIGLGGAAVAPAVSDKAERLGISTIRMYGSTEHPSITGGTHAEPAEKKKYTDGRLLPGCEIRFGDDGEIISRGPDCFLGYTDPRLTEEAFDDDGWYHTGDIGALDDDGYLSIVDRKKDIIIRGGENVSALEVEELLLRMPGIAEVAVVAAPDERLGEHACAFVRLLPDAERPTLETVRTHLEASGLARQKWPEDIRVVDDLPRTPSGKVKKFVLRQQLREEAGAAT